MALGLNGLARIVCVSLVRNTHLMMTYDFLVGDLFPSAPADEVLCFEAIITKEMRIGDQSYEFICWYILPILVDNGTIVNLTKVRPALRIGLPNSTRTIKDGATHWRSRCQSLES